MKEIYKLQRTKETFQKLGSNYKKSGLSPAKYHLIEAFVQPTAKQPKF
jgi:hypothetical protein